MKKSYLNSERNTSLLLKPSKVFRLLLMVLFVCLFANVVSAQKTWDGGGDGVNWSSGNNWNPNGVPTAAQTVVIANGINITVNTAAVCSTFTISGGGNANNVTISGANSLTVSGAVTIGAGTGFGDNKILNVGTGTLSCASIAVTATGSTNRTSGVTLSTGTVNVSGSVTMGDTNDDFTFTGAGTLNIGGTITGGTLIPSTGTVNYNSAGAQNVGNYTYYNLTLSGSGTKTFIAATSITNNFSIASGAIANLGTFTHSASRLTLGGFGTASGSWGSSSSSATNQNNTFFAATSGIVNVTNDTRATALFSSLTASQSICLGTATTTLSGVVSNGSVYATNGRNVVVTINGVSQNAAIAGGSGAFTVNYATSTLPANVYTITYAYAGDSFLSAATNNTATSLTVTPAVGNPTAITIASGTDPTCQLDKIGESYALFAQ